ncbi:MAG: Crp/Fnr family transcriptional regulator [Chitinophagales bacterium]|nr:Crp/Fnr family transcriptional regulator [Chitinophagales bacterium]
MTNEQFQGDFLKGLKKNYPNVNLNKIIEHWTEFEFVTIPKKEHLIKSGVYYGKIVFVISGLFRAYYHLEDTEHTFWFREENTVFASHRSILQNKPSSISYQALEDSVVAVVDYYLLKQMAKDDPEIAKSIMTVLEGLVLELIDRVEEFITMLPEERYIHFIQVHENIVTRLPQNQLASYLGITPVSFSRLKSRMMNR